MIGKFFTPQHHAYLLEGDTTEVLPVLRDTVGKELFVFPGNPDFLELSFENFTVEDARKITSLQSLEPLQNARVFIITFSFITREAQNVLLKTLEEPTHSTYLFLVVPAVDMLLPTLRSRLITIRFPSQTFLKDAQHFLADSVDTRILYVARFSDKENESRKSEFLKFIGELEVELHRLFGKTHRSEEVSLLHELLTLKKYVFDQAPSLKMIGEYLAVRLPVIRP